VKQTIHTFYLRSTTSFFRMSYVEEFIPKTKQDPIVNELCRIFISAFYEFYRTIESELNISNDKTLKTWLEETANETFDDVCSYQARCFIIYTSAKCIAGFLTTKIDENYASNVYLSQCAIDPKFKQQGYGRILLQFLSSIYPPETIYFGFCRRINQPALDFYRKCNATFPDNEQLIINYGYNPRDYLVFQFTL